MAGTNPTDHEHHEPIPPTGEEVALHLFAITMAGVCAVILLMIVLGHQ